MKKLIVIGIVAAMVMGLSVAASAGVPVANPDSVIKMGVRFINGTTSQGTLTIGTDATASDGFVSGEDTGYPSAINGAGEIICIDLEPQGLVTDGRYNQNLKAPLLEKDMIKIWSLKAYVNGGAATSNAKLTAWMTSTGKIDSDDYTVQLWNGAWTAQQIKSGAAGTALWTAPKGASGTSTSPQFTSAIFSLGTNEVKYYTMSIMTTTTPVPEPGTMAAMLSGLVGLVGFGIRRRK